MREKIQKVLDIIMCVLVLVVAIAKGGFYKEDILFPVVAIISLGFVYCVIKIILNIKENGMIKKNKLVVALDIGMILLPVAYALPVVFKTYVSLENSIFEFMRYVSTSVIYFILRTSKSKNIYLNLVLTIACAIAIFGIDEITYRIVNEINLPINYLPQSGSIVSSMVQYANVAAVLMIVGTLIAIYKFQNTKNNLYVFLIILLQSVVFLTTSRMAFAVTLGLAGVLCAICIKKNEADKAFFCVFVYTVSLMVAGIISTAVENNMPYIAYIVYLLVLVMAYGLQIKGDYIKNIMAKMNGKIFKKRKVVIYFLIIVIAVAVLVASIPKEVHVAVGSKVVKISNLNVGENALYFEIEKETEDTEYSIVVTKIYDTYKPEKILEVSEGELEHGVFNKNIEVAENIKYLEVEFVVTTGSVTVENAKVNGKCTALAYLFVPDRLVSRFKADGVFDLNNSLRLEYYVDGLKLWATSPIIGLGGEGFKLCYQSVQEENYVSSEAHSAIVQVLVEAGIVGGVAYIAVVILAIWISVVLVKKDKKNEIYLLAVLSIIIMSVFDLMFSFAIVTYVFAVILGCISNCAINEKQDKKYEFNSDNKSMLSMLKLGGFCIVAIVLGVLTNYGIKVYMASMIHLPEVDEESSEYEDKLYERITLLERRLELDKYNINYMMELDGLYYKYIEVLKQISINAVEDLEKDEANSIFATYLLRQKANADNMVECEYFSKYAIEKVAICYFENYIRYAEIMSNNFENDEVAYAFYLNYALKLTKRLKELGPKNTVVNNMYEGILKTYTDVLKKQNKYIKSITIESVIQDMQKELDMI